MTSEIETVKTRKERFIEELADYLVADQAEMSVRLSMGDKDAQAWSRLRNETPLFGWITREEAVKTLTDFLGR